MFIIFHVRKKIKRKAAFLHILEVGNDTGQRLKHAFQSLPGVQIHIVSTHQHSRYGTLIQKDMICSPYDDSVFFFHCLS